LEILRNYLFNIVIVVWLILYQPAAAWSQPNRVDYAYGYAHPGAYRVHGVYSHWLLVEIDDGMLGWIEYQYCELNSYNWCLKPVMTLEFKEP